MPLYDYRCDACGDFRDWRAMAQSHEPAACPICGSLSRRRVASPFIAFMSPHTRTAHQRNEKSAHEPKVMTRDQLDRMGGRVGHDHSHGPGPQRRLEPGLRTASKRWMIGH